MVGSKPLIHCSGIIIDILAKDVFNNFVIIEVKRANNSARDTITEILKYHALIKQKYKAKDGEIRIIIISTHWSEIIRAFSELVNNTTYAIKGYKIEIDPVKLYLLTFLTDTFQEHIRSISFILKKKGNCLDKHSNHCALRPIFPIM